MAAKTMNASMKMNCQPSRVIWIRVRSLPLPNEAPKCFQLAAIRLNRDTDALKQSLDQLLNQFTIATGTHPARHYPMGDHRHR